MSDDRPDDPDFPAPFPAAPEPSPFPPLSESGLDTRSGGGFAADDWNAGADAHDLPTRENRLTALGRFAFPPPPPLDDEGLAARDQRWTGRTIVFAALFLLVFNAVSPQNWARRQEPGWLTQTVERLSDVWVEQTALLGADLPRQGVREVYEAARDQRFDGADTAQP